MEENNGQPGASNNILNLANAEFSSDYQYIDSDFSFTDPPRYYKANDPYYYEVDNIPLKQIQENCLWLRDQITGKNLDVTGISTRKIIDLQPFTTNANRIVNVRPGKFTARINDALSSGANAIENLAGTASVDIAASPIYKLPDLSIDDSVFKSLIGDTVENIIYSNGLYDQYQVHGSTLKKPVITTTTVTGGTLEINFFSTGTYLRDVDEFLAVSELPKIKTAVWKQFTTVTNLDGGRLSPDLQQLATDFCRRWGGVFRTSVVNVPTQLSIEIPPFSVDDFADNNTTYDPQIRIDMLFLYTHPIDTTSTIIAKAGGTGLETITSPRLGLVKGAGSILTPKGDPPALNITDTPSIMDTAAWDTQASDDARYYDTSQQVEGADLSIQSPLSDQVASNIPNPFPGTGTIGHSFPSPDDLLNLAPLISQGIVDNELSLVGQSVLPLCYVLVKKDSAIITEEEIIDIRPFLRTAELTYNERSGVAAANPPLSLANPATGKAELYNAIEAIRDYDTAKRQILSEEVALAISKVPIAQPKCTLQLFRKNWAGNANLPIVVQHTQNNGDEPHSQNYLQSAPSYWSDVAGGNTFENVAAGQATMKLIPGKYLVEGSISSAKTDYNEGVSIEWYVTLKDGIVDLYPDPNSALFSTNDLKYEAWNGSSDAKNVQGSVPFSTILTLGENAADVATATTTLGVYIGTSGGSQTPDITGAITITRVANLDGSVGNIAQ